MLRTAIRPSSDIVLTTLTYSLSTLFGQRREVQADDDAVVVGRHAQVAVADRSLDRTERTAVMRLDHQHAGLGHGDRCHLLDRHLRAVVLRRQTLDERRRGPTRADGRELALDVLDAPCPSCPWRRAGFLRSHDQRNQGFGRRGEIRPTSAASVDDRADVPPVRIVRSARSSVMSNTTIGISLSRQNAIAVASMTLRSSFMTSM